MANGRKGLISRFGPSLFAWHRENFPWRTYDQYLARLQSVLSQGLSGTPTLYLDTNFWINLRDAAVQKSPSKYQDLLAGLETAVHEGNLVVALQQATFQEIAKQAPNSLRESALLLDSLTAGVAIRPRCDLDRLELGEFLQQSVWGCDIETIPPWTKSGLILKSNLPNPPPGIDRASRNAMLKSVVDELWASSIYDLFEAFNWETQGVLEYSIDRSTLNSINALKEERERRGIQYRKVREEEALGYWGKCYQPILDQGGISYRAGTLDGDRLSHAKSLAIERFSNKRLGRTLPGMRISTELFCLFNKSNRKIKSSDWFDMQHAAVALPYCSAFFTEKALAHQLCNELAFDNVFDCLIMSEVDDALSWISGL